MTLVGVSIRRVMALFVSVVLLLGATTVIANQSADAAYPGGTDWVIFESGFDIWAMPADGTTAPVNITSNADFEADPVFSPDGTQIAFAHDEAGSSAIYVADFDPAGPSMTTEPSWTQVSNGTADGEPTWSPDGTWIAFQRPLAFAVIGTATAAHATILTDAAASFVTDGVTAGMTVSNTTDGSAGLVVTVDSETQLTLDALTGGTLDTWTMADAYSIAVSHSQIFKALADGSAPAGTQLGGQGAQPAYDDSGPAWSPDGSLIAFTTNRNGNSDIYKFDTAGAAAANLTGSGAFDDHATRPSWSPDGTEIAFQSAEPLSTNFNIWTINATTLVANPVTGSTSPGGDPTAGDRDIDPAWSPDGSQIAFQRLDTGGDKIWVVAADGTGAATRMGSSATPTTNREVDWRPALTGVDDAYAVDEGATLIEAAPGVLDNDLSLVASEGTPTASAVVSDVANGDLTLNSNGSFTYIHDGSETTTDSFTYRPLQGSFTGTLATVTITVNPVDEDPVAVADGPYGVANGELLTVDSLGGVLANDTDPESLALAAVLVGDVTNGALSLATNGSFTYTHNGTETLSDSFTYQAKDPAGNLSAVTTASITVGSINPDPPNVVISGPSFGAPGVMASFTSSVTDGSGGTLAYDWSVVRSGLEVASGTSASLDFTPAAGGVHTVTVIAADTSGNGTDSADFTVLGDIVGSIFVGDIIWLAEEGVTRGCNPPTNDEFCPNDVVTRAQMAAFLVRFLGLTDDGGGNTFTDDDGSIFEADIAKLAAAGITRGCNAAGDEFCPNDAVTREQMAAFLVRALGLTDDGGGNTFTDDDGSIFEADIAKLAAAGITRGCNAAGDEFCPTDTVTRGQMAAFLKRAAGLITS